MSRTTIRFYGSDRTNGTVTFGIGRYVYEYRFGDFAGATVYSIEQLVRRSNGKALAFAKKHATSVEKGTRA